MARPVGGRRSGGLALLVLAVVLIGLNLRGPIVGVPPLIGRISADLGLSAPVAGLVTTLPLLCFAVGSPFVALLTRRLGVDRTVLLSLVLLGASILLRPAGGVAALLVGTVGVGAAITIGNVVVPVLVRRDAGPRTTEVMAASTSAYGVGQALTTFVAVPLATVIGWRGSVAAPAALVSLGLVVWIVRMRTIRPAETPALSPGTAPPRAWSQVWTEAGAWWLAGFFGLQAMLFYSASTWLPSQLIEDAGVSEEAGGTAVSVFHLVGIAGTLAVPALISALGSARRVATAVAAGWVVFFAGLLLAVDLWGVLVVLGGFVQGAGIGLALTLVAIRPVDAGYGRSVSAMVQSVGYALAATGPVLVGWAHEATGAWVAPTAALLAAAVLMVPAGLRAGDDEHPLGTPGPTSREQL